MKSKASVEFWVISVLFITGLLVRLYDLGGPGLSDDEINTTIRINHSLFDTIRLLGRSEFPPLHYIILNLWTRVFGNGEWALRFPSAVFSSLTIIVIYKLGKEFFNKNVGLIAASLLVFSPFAIAYAQNAKMYPLFWFLAAAAFLFFFRFLKDRGNGSYGSHIVVSVLCCYTMYTGFLFLVAQSMVFLLMGERTRWRKWFTGQVIIVSFFLPWVVYFLCSKPEGWTGFRPPGVAFDYFAFFLRSFQYIIGNLREHWAQYPVELCLSVVNIFLYVFLITFLLIDILSIFYKNKKAGLPLPANYCCLLVWMTVPVFIYFMFDRFLVPQQLGVRYIGFLQVPIILLVSGKISSFNVLARKILISVLLMITANNAYLYFNSKAEELFEGGPPQGWRATAEELTKDLEENDIVLSFIDIPMFKYYYKGDASRFFKVSWEEDFPSKLGSLVEKRIFTEDVRSIFVLYKNRQAPEIEIDGFSLNHKVSNNGMGFLHFQRMI